MSDTEETSQRIRLTLRMSGRVKRSTFDRETPDPIDEALDDVLHWSWSTRRQQERLTTSIRSELKAWATQRRGIARKSFSAASCEEHLLYVCAANLDRALERLPKHLRRELQVSKDTRRVLWLLRNVYEHWDEIRKHLRAGTPDPKGTLTKLHKEFPNADPWSFTIDLDTGEIILADVVSFTQWTPELRKLEARALRLERARRQITPPAA